LQRTFNALFSAAQDSVGSRELEANLALHTAELTADRQGGAVHCDISQPIAPGGAFDRAREYIEANLQAPLTMADICSQAEIRIRSLQRLFLRELDLTPTQYILARRLNSVRRQLIASEPEAGRVTDIAFRHGFNHLGRFAVQYRTFFGETPRQTLQDRSRP
jgi:AraC-like DNA-binding protein